MNKHTSGLLLLAILLSLPAMAQMHNFDLSRYKLPNFERRALETNFNLHGQNFQGKIQDHPIFGDQKSTNNNYYSNFYLDYHHILNTASKQKETQMGLNFSSDFYKSKGNNQQFTTNRIQPSLYYRGVNRRYYSGLMFYETNLDLNYQYHRNAINIKNSGDPTNKNKMRNQTLSASVPLKWGLGRIEQVQDARHAIYLFDELAQIDRVNPDKTDEQIIEFASLISQLKNKRFLDARLRKIAELESVDSFLLAKNYLNQQDGRYFATLNDYWTYGNSPMRQSGTRYAAVVTPGYYIFDHYSPDNGSYYTPSDYTLSAFLLNGGFELRREKPLNLLWQNSIDLHGYAGIIEGKFKNDILSSDYKIRIPNIRLGYFQTFGYYPNTRTDIKFGYSAQYVKLFDKTDAQNDIVGFEEQGIKLATNLSVNYYFSPQLRFNLTSSFFYAWQELGREVIINFDELAASSFMLNYLHTETSAADLFKVRQIQNTFRISLSYSFF